MKLTQDDKYGLFFVALVLTLAIIGFCTIGCSSQSATAAEKTQEEVIFELKCKLENKEKLVRAYENVLHQVWLDKPNYVEDALSETDEFYDLNEIMGETDVFQLRNAEDSLRYKYMWFHETDD